MNSATQKTSEHQIFSKFNHSKFSMDLFGIAICKFEFLLSYLDSAGGVQNLKWSNVERPIFRNLEITSIENEKDELFDYFINVFIFYVFKNYLYTQSDIWKFDNFSKFYKFSNLLNFGNYHFPNKKKLIRK